MSKVIISGYYGFGNFGDEAILSILIDKLKSLNAEITVISAKPQSVNTIQTFDFKNIVRAIFRSDILISGGGSLLQDVTGIKSLLYYCWVIFTALLSGKKTIIFAQGIGPVNSPIARFIVKNLLKKCTCISVRDENSQKLLENWKIKSDLVCDPFYSLEIPAQPKTGAVGIQLRDFKTMNDEFLRQLANSVAKHFPDRKIEIYSLQDSIDLKICKQFAKLLPNPEILSGLSVDEAVERISGLDFMIAMRFHAVLAAVKSNVKTLAIDYDIKVRNLAQTASLPIIQLNAYDDFDEKFTQLKKLEIKPVNACFNLTNFENIITGE
ncbi:MAG: polysaccharide pyruvyl transferase CsaB [Heliobacteriaceae bacterium]|nr:polysaccharide pyruvyl transferase CsaB [Heliobacteriaceae bacterium]